MEAPGVLVRQVRKRRSAAEKRLIVEQALEPGASVARVARAHGLNANVVFNWRRLYSEGKLAVETTQAMKLAKAAEIVENGIDETLSYYSLPPEHWRCLRTNNPLERLMREIRRRTRVVGAFPDGNSALMLVAARLRHVASTRWGTKRYLQMDRLAEVVAIA